MTQPSHWDTIESALHDSMSTRGAMTEAEYERWIADCEAALAFVAEQSAPVAVQPVPVESLRRLLALCRRRYEETGRLGYELVEVEKWLQQRPAAQAGQLTTCAYCDGTGKIGYACGACGGTGQQPPWMDATSPAAEAQPVLPDWSQSPEWAMWWCVQPSGIVNWSSTKPVIRDAGHAWATTEHYPDDWWYEHGFEKVDLPLGCDWRETLRKRPAAEAGA